MSRDGASKLFRGLVNTVPTAVLLLIGVCIVLALVLGGVLLVRRAVPATREGFDAEVSSQMVGIVATLFGLLLAFVVVLAFEAYSDAEDNVRLEADSLAQILRDSQGLSPADSAVISQSIGQYVRAVVEDEWPRLRDGESSHRATDAVAGMFAALQSARPDTPARTAFYDDAVRRLNDALSARRDRLADSSGGLSSMIVALVLVGSLVVLGYVVLVGSRSTAFHLIGAGAVAVVLGFTLVVLLAYNYPYSGSVAIDPGPFREGILGEFFPSGG